MKPKTFLFIGLAMVGVSLIMIFAFICNPSAREAYMRYEKCLDDYSKIFGMNNIIGEARI